MSAAFTVCASSPAVIAGRFAAFFKPAPKHVTTVPLLSSIVRSEALIAVAPEVSQRLRCAGRMVSSPLQA
jgi:hypothetical protein